jgi:hypothetical protein
VEVKNAILSHAMPGKLDASAFEITFGNKYNFDKTLSIFYRLS